MISQQHYSFHMTADRQQLGIDTPDLFPCLCFNVNVRRNVLREIPWHWHQEVEVDIITRGRGLLRADGGSWVLEKGDVFEQRYVRPLLSSPTRLLILRQSEPWQKAALDAIDEAYRAFAQEDFGWELLARAALCRLWQLAAKHADLSRPAEEEPSDIRRLKLMLRCIRENYARPLTLEEIAASANIGKRECLRCFQRTIGIPPIQCLLKVRIRQASRLLAETDLPVTEVGMRCGFENPSYFAHAFRRMTGRSPRDYRQYFSGPLPEEETAAEEDLKGEIAP